MLPHEGNSAGRFPSLFFHPHVHERPMDGKGTPEDKSTIMALEDASLLRYRKYSRHIRRFLYLGGLLQERGRSVTWSYVMGILVIVMFSGHCFSVMNFCRDHLDNLLLLCKCFGLTCSLFTPILMSICFLLKREKLIDLHEKMNDLFERELARDRGTVLATLSAFDWPSYMLTLAQTSTYLMLFHTSLITMFHQIIYDVHPRRYKLLLPAKFPWPIPSSGFLFYLHILYQFSGTWLIFIIGGVDSLFGFYAFQISSTLRAVTARLMNPRADDVFTDILRSCVRKHYQLVRCSCMLEDIWGPIALRMLFINTILICTLIFEATPFSELTFSRALMLVSYMAVKLLQTFIYSWYGSLITSASEHFREGVYFSQWIDSGYDRNVRANIMIVMMQKPIIIKAMKVSSVNVDMFTTVLNTAVSYFFVLQSLDESG